jgi:hypothetical protein
MESAHKADAKAIVATFPLGRLYLFTFKFMIHKLYELEEWAEKVKEIVEKSQSQFKPLGETEYVGRYAEGIKGSHGGKRKPSVPAGVGRRGDVHHTRSHSAGKTKGLGALPLRRRSRNAFLEALD